MRTDTIKALQEVLTKRNLNLTAPLEELERHLDVAHFWPVDRGSVRKPFSILRTQVSRVVTDLAKQKNLTAFVGRRGVKLEYIKALLDSKIVVVAQRDNCNGKITTGYVKL